MTDQERDDFAKASNFQFNLYQLGFLKEHDAAKALEILLRDYLERKLQNAK